MDCGLRIADCRKTEHPPSQNLPPSPCLRRTSRRTGKVHKETPILHCNLSESFTLAKIFFRRTKRRTGKEKTFARRSRRWTQIPAPSFGYLRQSASICGQFRIRFRLSALCILRLFAAKDHCGLLGRGGSARGEPEARRYTMPWEYSTKSIYFIMLAPNPHFFAQYRPFSSISAQVPFCEQLTPRLPCRQSSSIKVNQG